MPRKSTMDPAEERDEMDYGEWNDAPPLDTSSPTDGEVIHWMAPKPVRVGPGGVTATAAAAFVLGIGVAVGTLALMHWLGPEREFVVVKRRARG